MAWQPEKTKAEITSPLESNGAIPINIQDQHSQALDLHFIQPTGVANTLSLDTAPNDVVITLTDATGFVDGTYIGIFSPNGTFYFGTQIGAPVGTAIKVDAPIDKIYSAGSSVLALSRNMNIDGSLITQIFQIGPVGVGTALEVDTTRIMGYLQDGSVMDDAKFGGLGALTNGITLRQNHGVIQNYWNAKTNGELSLLCFDFTYSDKAPAGSYGARFRNTYAGQSKHGVTIRLAAGDTLEIVIRDNLTGLEKFNMMAQGHIVTD